MALTNRDNPSENDISSFAEDLTPQHFGQPAADEKDVQGFSANTATLPAPTEEVKTEVTPVIATETTQEAYKAPTDIEQKSKAKRHKPGVFTALGAVAAMTIGAIGFVAGKSGTETEQVNPEPKTELQSTSLSPETTTEKISPTTTINDKDPVTMTGAEQQETRYGQVAEYSPVPSELKDKQLVETALQPEEQKKAKELKGYGKTFWLDGFAADRQKTGVADVAVGSCVSFSQTYSDGTKVRQIWPNPMTKTDGKRKGYFAVTPTENLFIVTERSDDGVTHVSEGIDEFKIDSISDFSSAGTVLVKLPPKINSAPIETWGKNGMLGSLNGDDAYAGRDVLVGGVITVIDNGDLSTDSDKRTRLCADLLRNTRTPQR